ncbi:MAG TPA: phosphoribosyl-AMP cyclohydrolase [Candidatus Dormibacteraeota bacterium]|jgi:phosphoribosyl-AMP cyclohydrolase
MSAPAPDFSKGLVPAISQDAESGEVLMVAYQDEEAWTRTIATGRAWFHSRRRGLWEKGGTSGNFLEVLEVRLDCDRDAVLLRVRPAGPVCHTGARSCFEAGAVVPIGAGSS